MKIPPSSSFYATFGSHGYGFLCAKHQKPVKVCKPHNNLKSDTFCRIIK